MDETVTGEVELPAGVRLAAGAVIHVSLLDTSLADAPAVMVDDHVVDVATPGLAFVLRCAAPDPRASYSVSVHVDQDADGRISRGDCINAQSCPVLTFGHPHHVRVRTRLVG